MVGAVSTSKPPGVAVKLALWMRWFWKKLCVVALRLIKLTPATDAASGEGL